MNVFTWSTVTTHARRLGFEAIRQAHRWPRRAGAVAAALLALNALLSLPGWRVPYLTPVAWTALVAVTAWWAWHRLLKPLSTADTLTRRDEWAARNQGTAAWVDILEFAGRGAMRRLAPVIRPSLAGVGRRQLRRVPVTGYAVPLGRAGWFTVHTPAEMWTVRLGGPRMGKSGSLATHALDAPGALVVTSTRADLLELTGPVRAARGRVHVFNPSAFGGYTSTVRWSLLVGCGDYATAQRRAGHVVPASTGEGARWDDQARRLLALLLHAAALSGGSVADVARWISTAGKATGADVAERLSNAPDRAVALMSQAQEVFGANERTLTSITTTLAASLAWVADSGAAEIGDAALDHPDLLDVAAFVRSGTDSLYLVSPSDAAALTGLTRALTSELAHHARIAAGERPGGRLDPPLTLVLDEAPKACGAIPLHDWSADMGGRGVTGHIGAQSLSQLRETWGETGAETILTNCGAILVLGGISGSTDLEKLATLTGRRMVQLDDDDRRYVEVMAPAEIAGLRKGSALILRAELPPVLATLPWEPWRTRRDVAEARGTWKPDREDQDQADAEVTQEIPAPDGRPVLVGTVLRVATRARRFGWGRA